MTLPYRYLLWLISLDTCCCKHKQLPNMMLWKWMDNQYNPLNRTHITPRLNVQASLDWNAIELSIYLLSRYKSFPLEFLTHKSDRKRKLPPSVWYGKQVGLCALFPRDQYRHARMRFSTWGKRPQQCNVEKWIGWRCTHSRHCLIYVFFMIITGTKREIKRTCSYCSLSFDARRTPIRA